jgi:hypothetical protein
MFEPIDELKLLQDTYLRIWAIYMTFVTWFYGINIIAVAGFISSKDIGYSYVMLSASCAIIIVVLVLCGSVGMLKYHRHVYRRCTITCT